MRLQPTTLYLLHTLWAMWVAARISGLPIPIVWMSTLLLHPLPLTTRFHCHRPLFCALEGWCGGVGTQAQGYCDARRRARHQGDELCPSRPRRGERVDAAASESVNHLTHISRHLI